MEGFEGVLGAVKAFFRVFERIFYIKMWDKSKDHEDKHKWAFFASKIVGISMNCDFYLKKSFGVTFVLKFDFYYLKKCSIHFGGYEREILGNICFYKKGKSIKIFSNNFDNS